MRRTTCQQVFAGLALLACLSLCAPATANATAFAGPGSHTSMWSAGPGWLSSLWNGLKLVIAGGGNAGAAVAKHAVAINSRPGASRGGAAHIDDTSQINPDGKR